jgi:hypothetical protein
MKIKQLFRYALIVIMAMLFSSCVKSDRYNKTSTNQKMIEHSYKKYLPEGKTLGIFSKVKNYVGSENCKDCHEDQYNSWSNYYMSRFIRFRKDIERIPFDWTESPDKIREKRDEIVLIVGGRRNVALVAKHWEVLPYQYIGKHRIWKYRDTWTGQDYRSRCGPCHLTGIDSTTLEFSELGIGCEACHRAGKRHIENPEKNHAYVPKGKKARERCHFQGLKHSMRFKFSGTFH